MVVVTNLTVTNAKRINVTNWVTVRAYSAHNRIPDPSPRGECVVQATTGPRNDEAEWSQIAWRGGEAIHGRPNQRLVKRQAAGSTTITASIGTNTDRLVLWTLWAEVSVLTKGPRPPNAKPWSAGTPFQGPINAAPTKCSRPSWERMPADRSSPLPSCRLLASARSFPPPANTRCSISGARWRRTDFTDGARQAFKKSTGGWVDDTLQGIRVLTSAASDEIYDTDAPDLNRGVPNVLEGYSAGSWMRPCQYLWRLVLEQGAEPIPAIGETSYRFRCLAAPDRKLRRVGIVEFVAGKRMCQDPHAPGVSSTQPPDDFLKACRAPSVKSSEPPARAGIEQGVFAGGGKDLASMPEGKQHSNGTICPRAFVPHRGATALRGRRIDRAPGKGVPALQGFAKGGLRPIGKYGDLGP